jgi:nitroreductase
MRKSCLILALCAVMMASCKNTASNEASGAKAPNQVIETILARTSVRSYTDQKISDEDMNTILRAAMSAPSGVNLQPWHFIVLTDTSKYDEIFKNNMNLNMFKRAAAVVVTCADTTWARGDGENRTVGPNPMWRDDLGAATENLLIAATSLGIGSVWTACYPYKDRYEPVKEALGMPEQVVPYEIVALGYPDTKPTPKDKWKPERIHHDRW